MVMVVFLLVIIEGILVLLEQKILLQLYQHILIMEQ